jgi:hypothetical protein
LNRYRQVSGVTLKDGEAIHLNHEQTINYDRGSLKDADGKLVVSSPKRVSLDDNPFLESQEFSPKRVETPATPATAETARQEAAKHLNAMGTSFLIRKNRFAELLRLQ